MSTFPHLRPFLGMSAIFVRLIAQLSSTTSTQNSPVSTTLPLNSTTQLCCKFLDKHAPVSKRKVSVGKYSPWFSLVGDHCLQPRDSVDRQNESGEPQALQFTKNCPANQNTMSQNWSRKLSLFSLLLLFLQQKDCSSSIEQRTLIHHQQTCRQNKVLPSTDCLFSV